MTLFCSAHEFDDLCRDIVDKVERLRLQVKGGSMYPFIKSGDWVDIALFKGQKNNIRKGDIILFRKDDSLYLHRVLRRAGEGFVAKGDMSFGHDGVIYGDAVLARVVSVQSGDRQIDLGARGNRRMGVLIADLSVLFQLPLYLSRKMSGFAMSVFLRVQSLKAYRCIAKKILDAHVVVRPAVPEDEEELRDLYLMAGQDIREGIAGIKKEGFWLVPEMKNKIVGGLTVSRYEKNAGIWIIFGLEVKPWFRGLGIGEKLVEEAVKKAQEGHAAEIGLFVNKKSFPALALYRKLGFEATDEIPAELNRSSEESYLSKKIHE
jgi:GNAT superfamily N-acetyltransferase